MTINISTLLDVAIALVFIFFVFSMFVSGIVELINSLSEQRASLLRKALTKILGNLADDFYDHQLVKVKAERFWGFLKPINYLSADSFSTVLIDLLTKANIPLPADITKPTEQAFEKLKLALLQTTNSQVNDLIRPILVKSDNFYTFKAELERWYNGYMEQVSGWFKRYAQGVVWVVAVLITVGLNVDTIYLTNRLFNDNGLRERVLTEAISTAQDTGRSYKKDKGFVTYLNKNNSGHLLTDTTKMTRADSLQLQVAYTRFLESRIDDLKLPIGWKNEDGKYQFQQGQTFRLAILGWLLTAAALSFGAPFWFDLLLKLVNIRNTARRPPGNPDK